MAFKMKGFPIHGTTILKKREGEPQNGESSRDEKSKEVTDYFSEYLKSDLFKRRATKLHGEDWESVRDEKLNRLLDTKIQWTDAERFKEIVNLPKEKASMRDLLEAQDLQSKYRVRSDQPTKGTIYLNEGEAETYQDIDNLSYNPMSSMIANEYSHALGAMSRRLKLPYGMTKEERDMTKIKKGDFSYVDTDLPDHDLSEVEIKSDIDSTRFELWKAGLYNFDKDFKFDQSHIDYIKDNPDKFFRSGSLKKQFDDSQLIDMMNIFTSNEGKNKAMV